MAPVTRANSERGERVSDELNAPNVAHVRETRDHGSLLGEEAEATRAAHVDDDSDGVSTNLQMEKLESSMSDLVMAFDSFQEKYGRGTGTMASMSRVQQSASMEDEAFPAEHPLRSQAVQSTAGDGARHDERTNHAAGGIELNTSKSFTGDFEIFLTHIAYKIYQKGLESTRCRPIGDGSFFLAKRC